MRGGRGRGGRGGKRSQADRSANPSADNSDATNSGEASARPLPSGPSAQRKQAQAPPRRKQNFGGKLSNGSSGHDCPSADLADAEWDKPIDYADLRSRLVAELRAGKYDCSICYSTVGNKAPIWSCSQCHTVLHLNCIKQWASSSVKAAEEQNAMQEDVRIRQRKGTWRCPGCQFAREEVPTVYLCWDGQVRSPSASSNIKIPPHSCGKTCSKAKCIHGCSAGVCHPGPCPPCPVTLHHRCFCGGKEVAVRCSQLAKSQTAAPTPSTDDSRHGISCGEACNKLLSCGRHRCTAVCHQGKCQPCEQRVEERCYCGRNAQAMLCGQGERKLCSGSEEEEWEGAWQCQDYCDRTFACGEHRCSKPCHPPSAAPPQCPFDPALVKTCPCGAESLSDRKSCLDPIKTCGRPCNKLLACGHTCQKDCHLGDCPPCKIPVSAPCRCGESRPTLPCHERVEDNPSADSTPDAVLCKQVCRALRHCGRHECKRPCCPLAFQAKSRAGKPVGSRNRPPTQMELDEQDPARLHECTLPCGKPLSCGQAGHTCPLNCHRGPCPPCLRSCFEEVSCHCGRTVLEPPVPCGQRPVCRFPCARPAPACGHPKLPHDCHEEGPCPPCVYLTRKRCNCGRNDVDNIPCHRTHVSCGQTCGSLMPCGFHRCTATCHSGAPQACGDCTATCGKPKRLCGHPCKAKCHAPARCDESTPCAEVITVTCPCGHLRQKTRCGASTTTSADGQTVGEQRLKCSDACLVAQRNAKLAEALGLDVEDRKVVAATSSAVPYDAEMLAFYGMDHRFATELEGTLTDFIRSPRHSVILPSSSRTQRKFTHELAAAFGLATESLDPEPKRSVQVRRTGEARVPRVLPSEMWAKAKKEHEQGLTAGGSPGSASGLRLTSLRSGGAATTSPLNALLLEHVFGVDEGSLRELLTTAVPSPMAASVVSTAPLRLVPFTLKWAGEESVFVLPADPTPSTAQRLLASKHDVLRTVRMHRVAESCVACSVDTAVGSAPKLLRREDRPSALASGSGSGGRSTPVNAWSTRAAGAASPGGARLGGWAAVASGASSARSSQPMTPTQSSEGRPRIAPAVVGRQMAATTEVRAREATPEAWDQSESA